MSILYVTGEELEEDIDYFADVFAYTSDAIDNQKPGLTKQADRLAEKYDISAKKAEEDIDRMKETISSGEFPDRYTEEFARKAAFIYSRHSARPANIGDMENSILEILEE